MVECYNTPPYNNFDSMNAPKLHISGEGNKVTSPDLKRYRNFCTALFSLEKPEFVESKMKYLCYSEELCPTTQKLHYQLYVAFKNAMTIKAAAEYCRKTWKTPVMLSICKGTAIENRQYCGFCDYEKNGKLKKKNDTFVEFGKLPVGQGDRSDLHTVAENILSGEIKYSEYLISNPMTVHQYGRTMQQLEDVYNRKQFRTTMTTCLWLWGPSGCGKSHKALEGYTPESHYILSLSDYPWMDHYVGQDIVIINDYRTGIPYSELLQLIDKWPYYVRRRGRAPTPFVSKHIIVTSSMKPEQCYNNLHRDDNIFQLLRRITVQEMKPRIILEKVEKVEKVPEKVEKVLEKVPE